MIRKPKKLRKIQPIKVFKTAFTQYEQGSVDSILFLWYLSDLGAHELFTNKAISRYLEYKKSKLFYVWVRIIVTEVIVHGSLFLTQDYRIIIFYFFYGLVHENIDRFFGDDEKLTNYRPKWSYLRI